jgi:hypothetical protein
LTPAQIEEAISTVTRLEDLKSVRRLMDILRSGEDQRARKSA